MATPLEPKRYNWPFCSGMMISEAEIQRERNEESDGNDKRVLSTLKNVSLCTSFGHIFQ